MVTRRQVPAQSGDPEFSGPVFSDLVSSVSANDRHRTRRAVNDGTTDRTQQQAGEIPTPAGTDHYETCVSRSLGQDLFGPTLDHHRLSHRQVCSPG